MKKIILIAVLIMTTLGFAACVQPIETTTDGDASEATVADDMLGEIRERGSIRVSTDANYAPQSFLDADGNFVGFDVDVASEIAERLGVEVEFVTPDWDLITAGNWGGQWDISVGSMTVTTARSQVLDFASPAYYFTPAQFAAANDSGIDTLEDLTGQTICVGVSTTYESWLAGDLEGLGLPESSYYADPPADTSIIPLQTDNECAQQIQAGRNEFAAFLTSNTVVEAALAQDVPIHKVGSPVFSENLAVAIDKNAPKDNSSLVEEIGSIIAAMHEDGTLSALSTEWFGEDLSTDPSK